MKPSTRAYLNAVQRRLRIERSMFRALHSMNHPEFLWVGNPILADMNHAEFLRNLQWRETNTRSINRLRGAAK